MLTQNKIVMILGVAAAAAVAWFIPFTRKLIVELGAIVQSHGLYVFAVAVSLTIVLALVMLRSVQSARRRKRELDEVLRVAQQTNHLKVATGSAEKPIAEENTVEIAVDMQSTQSSEEALLQSNVTTGTFVKKRRSQLSADKSYAFSEEIFFQPVINMGNGNVAAYEVHRQISVRSRKNPVFVQSSPSKYASERAAFELATLEMIASTTIRPLWSENTKKSSVGILVHISEALLEDSERWAQCVALFSANQQLQHNATFCIDSEAFAGHPKQMVAERLAQLKALTVLGVELGLSGFEHDTQLLSSKQLKTFDIVVCEKGELLECHSGIADPTRVKAYTQISKARLGLVVSGISCDADVVDCMAAGIKLMSGDFLAPPRKLKPDAAPQDDAAE